MARRKGQMREGGMKEEGTCEVDAGTGEIGTMYRENGNKCEDTVEEDL